MSNTKLAISNIAWEPICDIDMYQYLKAQQFSGLEIAPTRLFQESPYEHCSDISDYAKRIKEQYNLTICSMQSIWYGRKERIFGTKEERNILIEYTKNAILFAEAARCHNLVFGCPKNRNYENSDEIQNIAIAFFKELGDFAYNHGTVIAMEANPTIYGTNYINTTKQAIELIKDVSSKGFRLNLDFGTVIQNQEDLSEINNLESFVNHIHISEPYLKPIENRVELHKKAFEIARKVPEVYISIEMGKNERNTIEDRILYINKIKNSVL